MGVFMADTSLRRSMPGLQCNCPRRETQILEMGVMGKAGSGGFWRRAMGTGILSWALYGMGLMHVFLAAEAADEPAAGGLAAGVPATGVPAATEPAAGASAPVGATPGGTTPGVRFTAGSQVSGMQWLAADSLERQVVWLQGEGATGSGARFLGLYLPNASARNEGGLVILPDTAQHPDWPGLVSGLRRGLPAFGWHTLAIQLREAPAPVLAARVLASPGSAEFPYPGAAPRTAAVSGALEGAGDNPPPAEVDARTATNAETDRLEQEEAGTGEPADLDLAAGSAVSASASAGAVEGPENALRIDIALQHLTRIGLLNQAVVGVGAGAVTALEHVRSRNAIPERGFAVVLINARFGEEALLPLAEQQNTLRQLILLDLYDSSSGREVRALANARRQFAKRQQMQGYVQASMPLGGLQSSPSGGALLARLAGWLQRVIPGQERTGGSF